MSKWTIIAEWSQISHKCLSVVLRSFSETYVTHYVSAMSLQRIPLACKAYSLFSRGSSFRSTSRSRFSSKFRIAPLESRIRISNQCNCSFQGGICFLKRHSLMLSKMDISVFSRSLVMLFLLWYFALDYEHSEVSDYFSLLSHFRRFQFILKIDYLSK